MKFSRLLSIPFTLIADAVSLGNMGEGSFTQQIFDDERADQEKRQFLDEIKIIIELKKLAQK